jgi:hypothetical protein
MPYIFLIEDLIHNKFPRSIGTDKGLAKIGDGIVNLAYSTAKSLYLTKKNKDKQIRTGTQVSQTILSKALKDTGLKVYAKTRADAHDLADTAEALIAYVWLGNKMTLTQIIDLLSENLSGDLSIRREEIEGATNAFTNLLKHITQFLPEIK